MQGLAQLWLLTLIGLGGGIGSVGRYLISGYGNRIAPGGFPLGTLAVNVVGCFLIAGLSVALLSSNVRPEYRLAILTGLLGGFTTFSSFGYETFTLLNDGQWMTAGTYVALSNGLGLAAAFLGYRLAEQWVGVTT